jgi:hypothetical protein
MKTLSVVTCIVLFACVWVNVTCVCVGNAKKCSAFSSATCHSNDPACYWSCGGSDYCTCFGIPKKCSERSKEICEINAGCTWDESGGEAPSSESPTSTESTEPESTQRPESTNPDFTNTQRPTDSTVTRNSAGKIFGTKLLWLVGFFILKI